MRSRPLSLHPEHRGCSLEHGRYSAPADGCRCPGHPGSRFEASAVEGLRVRERQRRVRQRGARPVLVGTPDFLAGQGVEGAGALEGKASELRQAGNTVIFVGIDGRLAGMLAIADPIKEGTAKAVETLHRLGLEIHVASGDAEQTARAVAGRLNINHVEARVKPERKYERVKALRADGRIVAMAGDAINDAPALVAATVSLLTNETMRRQAEEKARGLWRI